MWRALSDAVFSEFASIDADRFLTFEECHRRRMPFLPSYDAAGNQQTRCHTLPHPLRCAITCFICIDFLPVQCKPESSAATILPLSQVHHEGRFYFPPPEGRHEYGLRCRCEAGGSLMTDTSAILHRPASLFAETTVTDGGAGKFFRSGWLQSVRTADHTTAAASFRCNCPLPSPR